MTSPLLRARAAHQRVSGPSFASVEDAVSHFGCVQSQEFTMSKWALARRVDDLTDRSFTESFTSGAVVRTHILRPTWHLVLPRDLGWIMRLTAPRVHRLLASTGKGVGLPAAQMESAAGVIVAALSSTQPQTRAQLAEHLAQAGIEAHRSRLAHIVMFAELELLICNGPMIGKQHSYVLAPSSLAASTLTEDESLAELARTYVRGHGPSHPADLAWWSSLTLTQCRRAFALAGLRTIAIEGVDYFTDDTAMDLEPPVAALVPPFDESISYVTKPLDPQRFPTVVPDLARGGGLLFLGGIIGGSWSRATTPTRIAVTVTIHLPLSTSQRRAIEADAARLGTFVGLDHTLRIND